ncbi:unnamed protein product [Auanema sp. JU1783]|nr:unnamed protein product [Auanema sp. JU1783]
MMRTVFFLFLFVSSIVIAEQWQNMNGEQEVISPDNYFDSSYSACTECSEKCPWKCHDDSRAEQRRFFFNSKRAMMRLGKRAVMRLG